MIQNAGQDASTQFDDINHSSKAAQYMKGFYIGDFYNPEDEKESWEDYIARKQKEEDNKMSPYLKIFLACIFLFAFSYLYQHLTGGSQ
jgi:cytochrome b involved in lipid metabolism